MSSVLREKQIPLNKGGIMDALIFPSMVRKEFEGLSFEEQESFIEEFKRKQRQLVIAYILWLFSLHYFYIRNDKKIRLSLLFWLTGGGLAIWWIIDAFRIPKIIDNHNKDLAIETMKNFKAISA